MIILNPNTSIRRLLFRSASVWHNYFYLPFYSDAFTCVYFPTVQWIHICSSSLFQARLFSERFLIYRIFWYSRVKVLPGFTYSHMHIKSGSMDCFAAHHTKDLAAFPRDEI